MNSGDLIYKFELIAPLGDGGFGNVWRARDKSIDKVVALKILDASFQPIVSILEEARIANRLKHANVVPVLYADIADYNGKRYALLAQEFIQGGSLSGQLNSRNCMPVDLATRYVIDILAGLEYLHSNGIYHNDIKPSNILIGSYGQAQLADYGISGVDSSGKSLSITPKNAYKIHRAPETATATPIINPQTEVYQVGITAFRLLNGISLVKDDFQNLTEAEFDHLKAQGKIPRNSDYQPFIPQSLKAIVNKAIAVSPADRFKTALEMRRRLENLAFPVNWTYDNSGELVGEGIRYEYRLREAAISSGLFSLECTQKLKLTGRETRISQFCMKDLTAKQLFKAKADYFRWTINEGK